MNKFIFDLQRFATIKYTVWGDSTEKEIPNVDTTINSDTFKNNVEDLSELTAVTIPQEVVEIVSNTFVGCSNLNSITFEAGSKLEKIGEAAFYGCNSLESITIPASVTITSTNKDTKIKRQSNLR
ncbi:MAG: leucine-rich repeat protein [Selenomonadaceae bacterium]|nr:leucine-rich repeat protein [Selenomonadaceae bacterium]